MTVKFWLASVATLGLSALLSAGCEPAHAQAHPNPAPRHVPLFLQNFVADADAGQCNAAAYGASAAPAGTWTPEIRIDTDDRPGGCYQSFAIYDPLGELAGVSLKVDFNPDGQGQCDEPGERDIPITTSGDVHWSRPYRIDTDGRPGGCRQRFSIQGRADVALDVDFHPDGDAGQCGNPGSHTVTRGHPVELRLDTDGRAGGCRQKFRLRML